MNLKATSNNEIRDFVQHISLHECNLRIKFILDVAVKISALILKVDDVDFLLKSILIGVTSGEGLGFNRAFLFIKDQKNNSYRGKYAIGPKDQEEAGRIWHGIEREKKGIFDIIENSNEVFADDISYLNKIVKKISFSADKTEPLIYKLSSSDHPFLIQDEDIALSRLSVNLKKILFSGFSAVSPIRIGGELFGFIIVDNVFTKKEIYEDDLQSLFLFVGLLIIALDKYKLCAEYEEKLEKLQKMNVESERNRDIMLSSERFSAIGTMLDHILHEIKNPLSVLGGIVRIIYKKTKDSELKIYSDRVLDLMERLENTLENLANFAYPQSFNYENIAFQELIDSAIFSLQRNIENNHIKLQLKLPGEPIHIRVDRKLLKGAFYNILKNSIDAMPEGGLLIINAEKINDEIDIKIIDTGLGVARGHLRRIDEPFFTTKSQSMGLGLTVAKNIIEAHDGSICILRNKYGGTTVSLALIAVS